MMSWERDLEEVQRRLETLDKERDLAAAQAAAVSSRWVDPFSGFFLPLPAVAQEFVSLYGDRREPADAQRGERLVAVGDSC